MIGKKPRDPVADEAERARKTKEISEALRTILDATQTKRFREIMLQHRHFVDTTVGQTGIHSAVTYPGVAEAVKLTEEQKSRLIDGEHPVEVLTGEQRKAIRDMLGERYTGDYSTPLPGDRRPVARTTRGRDWEHASFLPHAPWAPTKLGADERDQVTAAVNRYQVTIASLPRVNAINPGANDAEVTAAVSALKRELRPVLAEGVRKEWSLRVDQLLLQSLAAVDLAKTLKRAEVQEALQLTAAQLVRIEDVESEQGHVAELVTHARLTTERRRQVLQQLGKHLDAKLIGTLTAEQGAKWNELIGEKWEGFEKSLMYGPHRRSQ